MWACNHTILIRRESASLLPVMLLCKPSQPQLVGASPMRAKCPVARWRKKEGYRPQKKTKGKNTLGGRWIAPHNRARIGKSRGGRPRGGRPMIKFSHGIKSLAHDGFLTRNAKLSSNVTTKGGDWGRMGPSPSLSACF